MAAVEVRLALLRALGWVAQMTAWLLGGKVDGDEGVEGWEAPPQAG
jgi:hypothetical protein